MPLPDRDFDVTEVAVPWRVRSDAGHQVVFATERQGTVPAARSLYEEMTKAPEFAATLAWAELEPASFDGLLLPGGHAPGMRQYLGSPVLRDRVAGFWRLGRPVGAICHGVLVLARTRDPAASASCSPSVPVLRECQKLGGAGDVGSRIPDAANGLSRLAGPHP